MTDPLSISASIAGLVTLADVVFGRVYKYGKSVKSASKDMAALSTEIGALYGILSNLRLLTEQLDSDAYESSTTKMHHVHACYVTLEKIKEVLARGDDGPSTQGRNRHTLKQKVFWPLKTSEVKGLIAEVEKHKSTLGLALNADGLSNLLRSLSKQNDIDEGVKDIQTELRRRREAETRIAIDEKHQQVLNSFCQIDTRLAHNINRKLHYPGTGSWVTESPEFESWQTTPNSCLWMHGNSGRWEDCARILNH